MRYAMRALIGSFLLAAAALVTGPRGHAQTPVTPAMPLIRVTAPAQVSNDVDVHVLIDNVQNLGDFQLTLTFDPHVLEFRSSRAGEFFAANPRQPLCSFTQKSPGEIAAYCLSLGPSTIAGVSGSGELAVVALRAIRKGQTELGLADVLATTPSATSIKTDVGPAQTIRANPPSGRSFLYWVAVSGVGVLVAAVVAASVWFARARVRSRAASAADAPEV